LRAVSDIVMQGVNRSIISFPIDSIPCIALAMLGGSGHRRAAEERSNIPLLWIVCNLAGAAGVGLLKTSSSNHICA